MEKNILDRKYEYEERPCRITVFYPKRCTCGDCDLDLDMCDILFTDKNEFKRRISILDMKEVADLTDSNNSRDNEMQEAPLVQGEKASKEPLS